MQRISCTIVAIIILGGVARAEDRLSLTGGFSHWSGDFGSGIDTDISAIVANASYKINGATLQVSAPWMRIDGPSAAFVGLNATPLFVAPDPGPARVREGLGDVTLGVAVPVPVGQASGFAVDLNGRVKAPTGSRSSGLSTGKADYAVGLTATKPLGKIVPSLSVSYRFFGDTGDWRLEDGVASSFSIAVPLPSRVTAVVSYDYADRASAFIDNSSEIVLGLSAPLRSNGARLTGFFARGLSNGAADISAGLSLGLNF